MSESIPVSAAFDLDYDGPTKEQIEAIHQQSELAKKGFGMDGDDSAEYWREAASNVSKALRPALSTPMTSILADGWNKYRPFLKYRDSKRYPPDVPVQEKLLEHTINAKLTPRVKIMLNQKQVGEVRFTAELSITLEGGTLTIQNGRFMKLRPGNCRVAGTLKCGNAVISKRESRKLELPGEISFGEGIPIGTKTGSDDASLAPTGT